MTNRELAQLLLALPYERQVLFQSLENPLIAAPISRLQETVFVSKESPYHSEQAILLVYESTPEDHKVTNEG